jgi:hypothetical protein
MLFTFVWSVAVITLVSMLVMSFFYNWLDARAASWDRLARLYETEIDPDSNAIAHGTFAMNDRRYRGVAAIGASRKGLYLALERSYKFLHPPLLIPWSEIEEIPSQTDGRCALRVKATAAELRMEGTIVRTIQKFLGGNDPRRAPLAA